MKNTCNQCKKQFVPSTKNQIYCSKRCTNSACWARHKARKAAKIDVKMFDWKEYKDGVIA